MSVEFPGLSGVKAVPQLESRDGGIGNRFGTTTEAIPGIREASEVAT